MFINRNYIKIWIKCNYIYLIIVILALINFALFFSMKYEINGNIGYHAFIDLGIDNNTVFAALMVGLMTIFVTIYINNQNLKILKFSLAPNAFQLKTNIEYELLFYQRFDEYGAADELETFIRIFNLFLNNKSNFRLIAPHTYEYILFEILMYKARDLDRDLPQINEVSIMIIRSLGKLILLDEKTKIPVKDIEFFDKYWSNTHFNKDLELKISKKDVGVFFESINDKKIREEILILYGEVLDLLKNVILILDSEMKR